MDEPTPSKRQRTKPDSLSDRLRLAIDRLTEPDLQSSSGQSGGDLVPSTSGELGATASVTEFPAAPTRPQVREEN